MYNSVNLACIGFIPEEASALDLTNRNSPGTFARTFEKEETYLSKKIAVKDCVSIETTLASTLTIKNEVNKTIIETTYIRKSEY